MRKQLTLAAISILAFAALAATAVPQNSGIAVVDNTRVFEESNPGKQAAQQIEANVGTWRQELTNLENELQGLLNQRQQQAAIMTPEALRTLDADIEQKQIDLQRRRDDAQRQANQVQSQVLAQLDAQLTPAVAALADELGYGAVLNSQSPGLLYYNPAADITDQLIARLNGVDQ